MHKQNQHIINISLLIAITMMFSVGVITDSIVFIVYYIGFIATILLLKLLNKNNQEFNDTITIYLSTLFFGFILAFMVNSDFIENGVTYLYPDQIQFFEEAKSLSLSNSVSEIINRAFYRDYIELQMVYFIFGVLGYLDRIVSGSAHFLPLLYSVVYVTAFIPVFLYHIVKLYLPRLVSLKSSLFYALLTPIMAFSGYLLRDMHITLITMVALFWMVRRVNVTRVIGMAFLTAIIYGIREANSLVILTMCGIFIFIGKSSKGIKAVYIVLGVGFLLYYSEDILYTIMSTDSRLDHYEVYTAESLEGSSGLGQHLYRLPPVIKELSIILFTLSAFPFIQDIPLTNSVPKMFMALYNSITNIGWFFIFFGVIYFIKPIINKILNMPNKTFLYLFILFVFYMITMTANPTFRRLICVFPFIYIPFLLAYNDATKRKRKIFKHLAFFTGLSLYAVYFILLI